MDGPGVPGPAPPRKEPGSWRLLCTGQVQPLCPRALVTQHSLQPRASALCSPWAGRSTSQWETAVRLAGAPPPPPGAAAPAPPALWQTAPWPAASRYQNGSSHSRHQGTGLWSWRGGFPGWPWVGKKGGKETVTTVIIMAAAATTFLDCLSNAGCARHLICTLCA